MHQKYRDCSKTQLNRQGDLSGERNCRVYTERSTHWTQAGNRCGRKQVRLMRVWHAIKKRENEPREEIKPEIAQHYIICDMFFSKTQTTTAAENSLTPWLLIFCM